MAALICVLPQSTPGGSTPFLTQISQNEQKQDALLKEKALVPWLRHFSANHTRISNHVVGHRADFWYQTGELSLLSEKNGW